MPSFLLSKDPRVIEQVSNVISTCLNYNASKSVNTHCFVFILINVIIPVLSISARNT